MVHHRITEKHIPGIFSAIDKMNDDELDVTLEATYRSLFIENNSSKTKKSMLKRLVRLLVWEV